MQQVQYENKLRAKGFNSIGRGLYANVFAKDNSDKVVKVARLDNWPSYIKWATNHGYAGTFAPKVESLKFYDGFYVAVMERLVGTLNEFKGVTSIHHQLYSEITAWRNNDTTSDATDLMEFATKLKLAGLAGDWHYGNVMVRKDGQIVVTDPTSKSFKENRFRIKYGQITAP